MSPPSSPRRHPPRGQAHLFARSAAVFAAMTADRRASALAYPVDPRTPEEALSDLAAALDRLPPELPGLVGALAMRGAVFGAHGAQVAA